MNSVLAPVPLPKLYINLIDDVHVPKSNVLLLIFSDLSAAPHTILHSIFPETFSYLFSRTANPLACLTSDPCAILLHLPDLC